MKKMNQQLTRIPDYEQILNYLGGGIKASEVVSWLNHHVKESIGDGSPVKTPQFILKFTETISVIEGLVQKILEKFEGGLDKTNLDELSPSFWEEMKLYLDSLGHFYACTPISSSSTFGQSADSILFPTRPFVNFVSKNKGEKKVVRNLTGTLQVSNKLLLICKSTQISRVSQKLQDRLSKYTQELSENLANLLLSRLEESHKRQGNTDYDLFLKATEVGHENPNLNIIETIKNSNQLTHSSFLTKYLQILDSKSGKIKKDELQKETLAQARNKFEAWWSEASLESGKHV